MKSNKLVEKTMLIMMITLLSSSFAYSQVMKDMKMDLSSSKAICVLNPTTGNNVTGTVTFTKINEGIKVIADMQGLSKGKHGIHIHEFGDCSAVDGTSAGGHFNPEGMTHAGPMDKMRHEGDMGNIEADENGKAHLEYIDKSISLEGKHSIIGRSVVVHKGEDDMKSQPAGNAGPRVACGVIGTAK